MVVPQLVYPFTYQRISVYFHVLTTINKTAIVWRYLKKLKMDLPFDPAIPLLEIYPNEPQIPVQKNVSSPMFIAVIFIIAKI